MKDYRFLSVPLSEIAPLRKNQLNDLKGQEHDPLEETIRLSKLICIKIKIYQKDIGYALIDTNDEKGIVLLEFYIIYPHRNNAKIVFKELVQSFNCEYWFVNTKDSFALPLLIEKGFSYEIDCFIFSLSQQKYESESLMGKATLDIAKLNNLQDTYNLIIQDGFYTGDGLEGLTNCIKNKEIYLLKMKNELVGVGFVSPLTRTPLYADIAM